jgi:serine/threonine kinase 32
MKEMEKARVYAKRSVESVMNELRILFQMKSDFIVNVKYAF